MAVENKFLAQIKNKPVSSPTTSGEKESKVPNKFLSQIKNLPDTKESFAKSGSRTLLQVPLGLAQAKTWPLDLIALFSKGEALSGLEDLDEARIAELKEKFPQAPWEKFEGINREKYLEGVQQASETFPTQGNIERAVEEKTGIPLTPKNKLQKAVRLGSSAAAFRPGNVPQKAAAAITAPTVSSVLQAAGAPESIAEFAGLATSGVAPVPQVAKATKPSGLTSRRFENVSKPTKVSPARATKINEAVEGDFRKIAENLFEENRTYRAMKEDPLFKQKIGDAFDKVHDLSKTVEGSAHAEDLRHFLRKNSRERGGKGLTPDEAERSFRQEIKRINKELPRQELTAEQLVDQYRKNNQSLAKYFEPGKSKSFNQGKKDALLAYNRSIADVIKQEYPNSEFSKLFEFTNKRWAEASDVEKIDKFLDNLFKEKVRYSEGKRFFERENVDLPFKRVLGEEKFKEFETLLTDLMSTERAMGLIRSAESQGFKDLAQTAGAYLVHPALAKTKIGLKLAKSAYQTLLDKPQLITTWISGVDAMKQGKFEKADLAFKELRKYGLIAKDTDSSEKPKSTDGNSTKKNER